MLTSELSSLGESLKKQPPARVLIVEDDAAFRSLLARWLRRRKLEVVEAASAEDALDTFATEVSSSVAHSFDVVVSDIRMSGMTGLALLATLRANARNLRIILITAFGDAATHREAGRLGAYAVFNKPFDLDDLSAAVLAASCEGAPD